MVFMLFLLASITASILVVLNSLQFMGFVEDTPKTSIVICAGAYALLVWASLLEVLH